jgi:hypothetical protein
MPGKGKKVKMDNLMSLSSFLYPESSGFSGLPEGMVQTTQSRT